ncbi:hypothetical protein EGH24_02295 [Halonotius terrestris]|uniref:IclR helix-turn-helix domain-containing protein n=1 Tax=Halonotius terrestris TaxID=2487750 RepID=A0A8J8PBT6_9EURY|nr:hypothetical protein [Halonotius terrestris]TQQ83643.1 hypothetical protein EGH24_02295 [Halonotius terrestris]
MELRTGLLVALLATTLIGATTVAAPAAGQTGFVAQQTAVDADDVRITISVTEDGTAEWELAFRRVLDTDDEEAAFESLQADIADDPAAYTDPFAERIRRSVADAENATGREMAAEEFSVDTETQSLGREYGIVTYSFTWQNFAQTADGELRVGDAIDGFFLDDQTRLRVQWPADYTAQSVTPDPDETPDNAVVWDGESTDFVGGEPRVVIAPGGGLSLGLIGGVIGLLLLAGVGGWYYRQRNDGSDGDGDTAAAATASTDTTDTATSDADAESASDAEPNETADTAESTESTSTESASAGAATAADEPDPELLSNEEQVLKLLDENGGRMKQKQVVEELGWTDAKTSKVVSGLREEGTIDSFRIGRENVLTYPDEGLTDNDEE